MSQEQAGLSATVAGLVRWRWAVPGLLGAVILAILVPALTFAWNAAENTGAQRTTIVIQGKAIEQNTKTLKLHSDKLVAIAQDQQDDTEEILRAIRRERIESGEVVLDTSKIKNLPRSKRRAIEQIIKLTAAD